MKPYKDLKVTDSYIIREFTENIDPIELMYFRLDQDRAIDILEVGKSWKIQFDDQLPFDLEPEMRIFILRHMWHRVIKGDGNLKIQIQKING